MLPQNRDLTGQFLPGHSGNPGGRPVGFHNYIQERTADGSELTDFVLSVFRGENGASTKERMDAATWLADRGFGKPTVNAGSQAPGDLPPIALPLIISELQPTEARA